MITIVKKWFTYFISIALLGLIIVQPAIHNSAMSTNSSASSQDTQVKSALASLPLSFEANVGQTDSSVRFLAHGAGYLLLLTDSEAVVSISAPHSAISNPLHQLGKPQPATASQPPTVLHYQWLGANIAPKLVGLNELPGKSNYFIGNDPAQWHTNVPNYARVEYQDIYPGINLAYYGKGGQAEYDFIAQPGADPSRIKMTVAGADKVTLEAGELVLHTALGDLRQPAPHIYQDGLNGKQVVVGGYTVAADGTIGFRVDAYDTSRALVIDPTLAFSTYLGGTNDEIGFGIATLEPNNTTLPSIYITGQTATPSTALHPFPITSGAYQPTLAGPTDAFVTKIVNNNGTYSYGYSTYLGGRDTSESFSGNDVGYAIAVDSSGEAYVTGSTDSQYFPTTTGAYQRNFGGDGSNAAGDAFVTKLNATGSGLLFSTYLGGGDDDEGAGIAIDSSGNAFVRGDTYSTGSTHFPTYNAIQGSCGSCSLGLSNAFVTELKSDGKSVKYSTYLGGTNGSDGGQGIAIDSSDNAYVTGSALSTDFPTTTGAYQTTYGGGLGDAFVTKVPNSTTSTTTWTYSTYIGGLGTENGHGIALDSSNNAYITGGTSTSIPSNGFPATSGAIQPTYGGSGDAFVTKMNSSGSGLLYSTYLGGSQGDEGHGIAVDAGNDAFITGRTASTPSSSTPFPIVNAIQSSFGGGTNDAFVTQINATPGTNWAYSTYFGGTGSGDSFGLGIALGMCPGCSTNNAAYVIGQTNSSTLTTAHPTQSSSGGGSDAFIIRINH